MSKSNITMTLALAAMPFYLTMVSSNAYAKEKKVELAPACPIDGTLRTADPKLLERFKSLTGCVDQILLAPAAPSDYMDPDGTVIIRNINNPTGRHADLQDDDSNDVFEPRFANMSSEDSGGDSNNAVTNKKRVKKERGALHEAPVNGASKSAKTEYVAYGAASASPNLAGTGIMVRIVPEEEKMQSAAYMPNAQFAANIPTSGLDGSSQVAAGDAGILSMRPQSFRTQYDDTISQIAVTHRIDPLLLHAVIYQESRYKQRAVSQVGAQGLMQIMPGTGRMLGVHPSNLNDPMTNIDAGARLLRKLYYRYDGNFELVLAAYNAGEGAVQKYGNRIPPYRETQDYVKKVMARYYFLLTEQNGVAPAQ